jgi:hypothetical protein
MDATPSPKANLRELQSGDVGDESPDRAMYDHGWLADTSRLECEVNGSWKCLSHVR